MRLTSSDYARLLSHYGYSVPRTRKNRVNTRKSKEILRGVLADKLCRCIKKVQKTSKLREPAAIAICNKSVFSKKGLRHYRFKCKPKATLRKKKGSRHFVTKTRKNITLRKKTRPRR